jgi:Zn-dependent protease/CBS domain-containing protein
MSHGSLRLGRVAGIGIYAHWSTLATLAIFTWVLATSVLPGGQHRAATWIVAGLAALALLLSILGHELAHTVVARRHGVRVERITLWLLGGTSELTEEPTDAKADLRIAVAGPLASGVLGFGFLAAAALLATVADKLVDVALVWLALANIGLAVFNLLPAAPLDGGRVLRAIVWRRTGDRLRAAAIAARSGRGLGLGLIALGVAELLVWRNASGLWLMLLGWFLRTAANAELAQASTQHRLGDLTVGEVMTEHPAVMAAEWPVSTFLGDSELSAHKGVFPVVDRYGRPVGEISLRELAGLTPEVRDTVPAADVARPLPRFAIARADSSLAAVVARTMLRPGRDLIAVVDADGRLVGVLTATDLAQICDRTALGLDPVSRPKHR